MKTLSEMPDLSIPLKKMRIINELMYNTNQNTVLGISIINAINENLPANELFKFIKDQGEDNPGIMIDVIGSKLYHEISNL